MVNTDDLGACAETTTGGKATGHGTKKNVDLGSLNKRISINRVGGRHKAYGDTIVFGNTFTMLPDHSKGLRLVEDESVLVLFFELNLLKSSVPPTLY